MKTRRLKLFGHIVRFDPDEDHALALNADVVGNLSHLENSSHLHIVIM